MELNKLLSTAAMATILTTTAANAEVMIKNIPDEGVVKVTGEVIAIEDENEFTISDMTGKIDVESETDLKLSIGDNVIVTGEVDSSLFSKEIDASLVQNMAVISNRANNTFINTNSYELAKLPAYTNERYEPLTKMVDGNTIVKDVKYGADNQDTKTQ